MQARSVFRATGRPSSCAFEGRYAPRSPDPRTNGKSPSPQQRPDAVRGPKQRGEHQPSKPLARREKLSRPRSPASTPRFDVPPEQRSWSLNMSWLQFNAGPSPGTCHWLQFNAGPSPSGAPPGCSGETCSLSGETKAPTATATCASCHEARHNRRSLPNFGRRVSSGGALLSSAMSSLRVTPPMILFIWQWAELSFCTGTGQPRPPQSPAALQVGWGKPKARVLTWHLRMGV